MADSTLPPDGADRGLLLGVLGWQLDFINKTDLQSALQDWYADRSRSFGQLLVERQALAPRRRVLLEELVDEYLVQHDMDIIRGLAAACASRATAIDFDSLTTPAQRGNLATLPSSPGTTAGSFPPPPTNCAVGMPTSSGLRFRILRPHARGALGIVYLALDEELHREVALKEIQDPYHRSPESRARFLLEAEITGTLEHPGIVPVYGLGHYADGRPYYAMRFIKGESLHDAIGRFHLADLSNRDPSERTFALRGLLRRFVDVCNAVAYAHSRGVVHRDIKPSNVMLGQYGETLVVDWGLAKVFDKPCTVDSIEMPVQPVSGHAQATMLGQAVGTPAFMPPEQAEGRIDDIGPGSDIYSLGATLYNLLTGLPPFPGQRATEVIKQVQKGIFAPPRQVKRQVPPALEAIVLKAMARNPDDRYASAAALAHDVERWLADEPVDAYPEPIWQKAQRWTKRNRTLVSGTVVLMLTALIGLGIGLYFVGKERDLAQQNFKRAEANLVLARKAVDECFTVATEDPMLQKDALRDVRKLLLEKALPFYEGFRSQKPDDSGISTEYALNFFRVAEITEKIGRKDHAIRFYEQARDLYRKLVEQETDKSQRDIYMTNLARICKNLGAIQKEAGELKAAEESSLEAQRLIEDLVNRLDRPSDRAELASIRNNLGDLRVQAGKPEEAKKDFLTAERIQRNLVNDPKTRGVARYRRELAATLHGLGTLHAELRDFKAAASAFSEAREIRQELALGERESGHFRGSLGDTLINQGVMFKDINNFEGARDAFKRADDLFKTLITAFTNVAEYQAGRANALINWAELDTAEGNAEVALGRFREAETLLGHVTKENPLVIRYKQDLAGTLSGMGGCLCDLKKYQDALNTFDRVLPLIAEIEKGGSTSASLRALTRRTHAGRAFAFVQLGKHRDAIPAYDLAINRADLDDRIDLRVRRSYSLIKEGLRTTAMKELEDLEKQPTLTRNNLYILTCVAALSASAVEGDTTLSPTERKKLAIQYASKAIVLLEKAWKAGIFSKQYDENGEMLAHVKSGDPDLASIRDRSEFQSFVKRVEANLEGK